MSSGKSSIEQRPDRSICVVRRISGGMMECEGDGSQRKSEAVEKKCKTSGDQIDMTDLKRRSARTVSEQLSHNVIAALLANSHWHDLQPALWPTLCKTTPGCVHIHAIML